MDLSRELIEKFREKLVLRQEIRAKEKNMSMKEIGVFRAKMDAFREAEDVFMTGTGVEWAREGVGACVWAGAYPITGASGLATHRCFASSLNLF